VRYAVDRIWDETAYLAYYVHWSFAEIVDLPHAMRLRMVDEVGKIHTLLADANVE
jgi:hypothetical protein